MTGDKATQLSDRLILDGATEPDEIETSAGGGSVVALTVRDPCKETENEDTVAVIPYGPEAVVLVVADGAGGEPLVFESAEVLDRIDELGDVFADTVAIEQELPNPGQGPVSQG